MHRPSRRVRVTSAFDPKQTLQSSFEVHSLDLMPDVREAILNSCRKQYSKVAMVIARASERLGDDSDETYELVGQEIAKLVEAGHLQAVGDISQWRHSEVRLPQS